MAVSNKTWRQQNQVRKVDPSGTQPTSSVGKFPPNQFRVLIKRKRSCFAPDTAIVNTTTPKTITENGAIRKRSPEWSDLKTMLFENAASSVDGETMTFENGDVIIDRPGARPLVREYPKWRTDYQHRALISRADILKCACVELI